LLLGGSTAAPRRAAGSIDLPPAILATRDATALNAWIESILATLARQPFVAVMSPAARSNDPQAAARIGEVLAALAKVAIARCAIGHLMIEGGATAAAVLQTLGWSHLTVTHEWAQGIVTLQPTQAENFRVTMKPGSYHWADPLWTHVRAPL
jgi:uncharacterized protein YgbK (DUF1537 family)